MENNRVSIVGHIISNPEFSHEVFGEAFYVMYVSVERLSGNEDIIPVTVSERLVDVTQNHIGGYIQVNGRFNSYNRHDGNKNRLVLSVFAQEIGFVYEEEEPMNTNQIFLNGYICKAPVYRKTPLGREIADFLLAVNRSYGKSDYIPCICWGRNAKYVASLRVGSHMNAVGRIQSREYQKKVYEKEYEIRTAYEVSISVMKEVFDEQK